MIVETEAGSATFYGTQPADVIAELPMYLRMLFRAASLHDFSVEFPAPHAEPAPRVSARRFVLICDEAPAAVPDLGPLGFDLATLLPDLRAAHSVVIIEGEPTVEAYAAAVLPLMKDIAPVAVLIETSGQLADIWLRTVTAARGGPDGITVFREGEAPLAAAC